MWGEMFKGSDGLMWIGGLCIAPRYNREAEAACGLTWKCSHPSIRGLYLASGPLLWHGCGGGSHAMRKWALGVARWERLEQRYARRQTRSPEKRVG